MNQQTDNVSRKVTVLRNNQKEMLEIKNTNRNMPLMCLLIASCGFSQQKKKQIKHWEFEKIYKMNKPLASLTTQKKNI